MPHCGVCLSNRCCMVDERPDPQHHPNVRTFVTAGPEDHQASLERVFSPSARRRMATMQCTPPAPRSRGQVFGGFGLHVMTISSSDAGPPPNVLLIEPAVRIYLQTATQQKVQADGFVVSEPLITGAVQLVAFFVICHFWHARSQSAAAHATAWAGCALHAGDSACHTSTPTQGHASKITPRTSAQTAERLPEEFKHVQATRLAPNAA